MDSPAPEEPILLILAASVKRVIQHARESVFSEKINIFDQTAVNTFRDHATKAGQPLLVSLRQNTYHRYRQVWLQLLCFLHRTAQEGFDPNLRQKLRFQLLPEQRERYQHCIDSAREWLPDHDRSLDDSFQQDRQSRLDRSVTAWSLSLLCQPLHGDRYESGLVSFLALSGINQVSFRATAVDEGLIWDFRRTVSTMLVTSRRAYPR